MRKSILGTESELNSRPAAPVSHYYNMIKLKKETTPCFLKLLPFFKVQVE